MSEKIKAAPAAEPRRVGGRPKAEDLAELEARILRAALDQFLANGYGAASMNEVARSARISKGTLWARFPSKADLFRAIIDDQIRLSDVRFRHPGPKPKTLEAMLRAFAERALQDSLSWEIIQLNRLIYAEAGRFPELGEAAANRARVGVRQVADFIREYAEKEQIPCADPDSAADMFTTLLRGFYGDVMLTGEVASAAEISAWTQKMLKVFLAGRKDW
jgi:TetR/AcrR family transcriptional regulator, mexJK operon transcriptional repressor